MKVPRPANACAVVGGEECSIDIGGARTARFDLFTRFLDLAVCVLDDRIVSKVHRLPVHVDYILAGFLVVPDRMNSAAASPRVLVALICENAAVSRQT